jgi:hypothetical protein
MLGRIDCIDADHRKHERTSRMNKENHTSQPSVWQEHRNKFILSGLFLLSFIIHLLSTEFKFQQSIGSAIAQLIGSWLLSYVAVQFANKYYNFSTVNWWIRLYAFMVGASLIALIFFPDELQTMMEN